MANPSLQIGNSNWAMKKDNLLGYSTAGTRFLPIPITMTRASAGTRVNPQGLVETVELLGSEEIIDGGFPNDSNDWSEINGGTIINNEMVLDCGGNTNAYTFQSKATSYTSGKTYKLTVKVASNTTGVNLILYPFSNSLNTSVINIGETAGTYTIYFVADYTSGTGNTFALRALSSTGTLTIDNVSVKESTRNDLARVDYTGSTSSLLAEPQRTNEYTESTNIDNWTFSNATGTSNYSVSPDGTQNASRLLFSGSGYAFRGLTQLSGVQYTVSVYAKRNDSATQSFGFFVNGSGAIDSQLNITSEWKRFTYTYTTTNTSETGLAGDSGADISFYGFQKEQGSYATSIIPTSGSAVTRNQDIFTRDGIGSLIGSEGVLFIEMAALSNDLSNRGISLNDGTQTNRLLLYFSSASNQIAVISTGFAGSITYTLPDETSFNKIAVRYKANDITLWVDGVSRGTPITSATIPTFTALKSNSGSGSSPFYGKVKQLQVYKTALTDEQLLQLTGTSGTDFYESYAEMASALTYTIQ